MFSVAMITTLNKMITPFPPPTLGIAQFEWPQEIICFLEFWSDGEYLMDKIFHADDVKIRKRFVNDRVARQSCTSTAIQFAISSLVD
jgi:hypothetical protein